MNKFIPLIILGTIYLCGCNKQQLPINPQKNINNPARKVSIATDKNLKKSQIANIDTKITKKNIAIHTPKSKSTISTKIFANICVKEATKLIEQNIDNPDFVILDVRTNREVNNGHIPDAISIDFRKRDFKNKIRQLNYNKTYLVYCKTGYRSKKTIIIMKNMGFKKLYNMRGGFDAWRNNQTLLLYSIY